MKLNPGEKRTVTVEIDPKYLSIMTKPESWTLLPGDYTFMVAVPPRTPAPAAISLK